MHRIIKCTIPILLIFPIAGGVFAQQTDPQGNSDAKATADYMGNSTGLTRSLKISNQPGSLGQIRPEADDSNQVIRPVPPKKVEPSEFQNFIKYATGKNLAVFGSEFFQIRHLVLPHCKIRQCRLNISWVLVMKCWFMPGVVWI